MNLIYALKFQEDFHLVAFYGCKYNDNSLVLLCCSFHLVLENLTVFFSAANPDTW